MNRAILAQKQQWIREDLDRCIRFWLCHGIDKRHGGVYTQLDKVGNVYCTDKNVWMQGRGGWMFSYLCNQYGVKDEWLAFARNCLDFAENHCVDHSRERRMYHVVAADGHPLRWRMRFHSEGFYCIANAEHYALTHDPVYLDRALSAFQIYWGLYQRTMEDPFASDPMAQGDNRPGLAGDMRTLDLPMICLNICMILSRCHPENAAHYDACADHCVRDIFRYHRKEDMHCTLENVGPDGEFLDTPFGRQVNPGHDLELSWFLMEYARKRNDQTVLQKALSLLDDAWQAGWDQTHGGITNMLDAKGMPPAARWYDLKVWWPQTESLIAPLMAYQATEDEKYLSRFTSAVDYCARVFSDPVHGEWYDSLLPDNTPHDHSSNKGNINKGPFHTIRALAMCDLMITDMLNA